MKFSMFIHPPRPKPRSTRERPSPLTTRLPWILRKPEASAMPFPLVVGSGVSAFQCPLRDALDKASLHDQEQDYDGHRAQEGTGHDRAVLLAVGADQGRQAQADRKHLVLRQHDQRPDVIVPRGGKEEDSHHGYHRPG